MSYRLLSTLLSGLLILTSSLGRAVDGEAPPNKILLLKKIALQSPAAKIQYSCIGDTYYIRWEDELRIVKNCNSDYLCQALRRRIASCDSDSSQIYDSKKVPSGFPHPVCDYLRKRIIVKPIGRHPLSEILVECDRTNGSPGGVFEL